jgi:uncharacterized membrane protein YhaH (DUF805 family)
VAGRSSRAEYFAFVGASFLLLVLLPYAALRLVAAADTFVVFLLFWWVAITANLPILLILFFAGAMSLGAPMPASVAAIATYSIFAPFLMAPLCVVAIVRRLHDLGRGGWWILCLFPPQALAAYLSKAQSGLPDWLLVGIGSLGWLALAWFLLRRGNTHPNAFGPPPP